MQAKPIPVQLILDKLLKTKQEKQYQFPTQYGVDNPKIGFDQRRYYEERKELTAEERFRLY